MMDSVVFDPTNAYMYNAALQNSIMNHTSGS